MVGDFWDGESEHPDVDGPTCPGKRGRDNIIHPSSEEISTHIL